MPAEDYDQVLQNLVDDIMITNNGHLSTGIVGIRFDVLQFLTPPSLPSFLSHSLPPFPLSSYYSHLIWMGLVSLLSKHKFYYAFLDIDTPLKHLSVKQYKL